MKFVATRPAEQNTAVLDPWSAVHLAAGLASGLLGVPRAIGLGTAAAYEVVELYGESHSSGTARKIFLTKGPESVVNITADLVLFAIGQRLGHRWRAR